MIDIRCTHCDRFLKIEPVATMISKVVCPDRKCKQTNNIKIIFPDASEEQVRFKFDADESANLTPSEARLIEENKLLQGKLKNNEDYIAQLEGIVDGQG